MAGIRLDVSVLVGVITQAVLFGVYQVLFFACIYVLLNKERIHINWPFLIAAILMWILICANFALSWSRIMDAFIGLQAALATNPNAINEYFDFLAHWKEVFRSTVYLLLTAVADSLFIYRLYVVWNRNIYIVIVPFLMLCATITMAIIIAVIISSAGSRLFTPTLTRWARAFFTISLVQNVSMTFLIIFRIWRASNGITGMKSNSLWPVVTVLLESGAIYSSTVLVLLATYASGSYSQYIAIDMLVPIIGITFNLIIVRVGLGLSHEPTKNSLMDTTHPVFNKIPLQRATFDVTQQVHTSRSQEANQTRTSVLPKTAANSEDDASLPEGEWK